MDKIPTMNRIDKDIIASSKYHQLSVAKDVGLITPKTISTDSKSVAIDFAKSLFDNGQNLAMKNVASDVVIDDVKNVAYKQLTQKITATNLEALNEIKGCPVILQEFIEKENEYRVTVVGDRLYNCQIQTRKGNAESQLDFRNYDWKNVPYYSYCFSDDLNKAIIQFMKKLNLPFGCLDFGETKNGEIIFFEVNSLGAYLWIEDLTNLKITEGICEWLNEPI
jgi:glutathione synthase/RimK-type ligase-like ATP-grasp enzyme